MTGLRSLDDAESLLIAAVVRGGRARDGDPRRRAFVRWGDLAAAGHAESTRDRLLDDGWLVGWIEYDALSLSPLATRHLGLALHELGRDEHPAFADRNRPEPRPRVRRHHRLRSLPDWLAERIPAPAESPHDDFLMDEYSGKPVLLFRCHPIRIDRRVRSKSRPPRRTA